MGLAKLVLASILALGCGGSASESLDASLVNHAPKIKLVERGENYTERDVRKGLNTSYTTDVNDEDGDDVECRFDFSDGYTRDWDKECGVIHIIEDLGTYLITAKVRDLRGLDGESYYARLHVMSNIPPIVVATVSHECEKIKDGKCVYTSCINAEPMCFNGSDSYDKDGNIISYTLDPDTSGGVAGSSKNPILCGGYIKVGMYLGAFCVIDNEYAKSCLKFYGIGRKCD